MSYPTGGSGYNAPATPSAPPSFGQSAETSTGSTASGSAAKGLPFFLVVGVAALGVINFLMGFLPFFGQKSTDIGGGVAVGGDTLTLFEYFGAAGLLAILLMGGLLAALSLLPKQNWTGAAAAASAAGFLGTLIMAFSVGSGVELEWGAYLLLFLALVQTVLAIVAVLFEAGIMKAPAPQPASQQQGPPSGLGTGGYGQPSSFGQGQQGFGQSQPGYGQSQPGQSYGQQPGYGSQTGPQYQSQQPYGQSQPSQPSYGQSQPPGYGQQPSYGQQPGYGAAQQGSPQGSPYGQSSQPRPDESATQHFGAPQYGSQGGFGQSQPGQSGQSGQSGQPFGGEQGADPASDATHAFRPSDDNK